MPLRWDDRIDEIINGDAAAAVGYPTPAKGVVITPMAPLGLRDRERGTVTVTTSLGLWKKVVRIKADPSVVDRLPRARARALATAATSFSLQGRATVQEQPDREWLESITPQWERFLGPRETGWRGRLMEVYYWNRIGIEVEVERILRWDRLDCAGEPEVIGAPLPAEPQPQKRAEERHRRPPQRREARPARALAPAHDLLGWVGSDGLPMLVAARPASSSDAGLELDVDCGLVPPGGRRAGLTAHGFEPRMIGQEQRIYTGWLTSEGGSRALYAPHTLTGNKLPPVAPALRPRRRDRNEARRPLGPQGRRHPAARAVPGALGAQTASGGRSSGQPSSRSSCAASDSSRSSRLGGATSWAASGSPSARAAERDRGGRVAEVVPGRGVGIGAAHPEQRPQRSLAGPAADLDRRARRRSG